MSQSKLIDIFVKTFKPLLSSKLASRIHVCQDLEELHSNVDKELLPVEYGGAERSIEKLNSKFLLNLILVDNSHVAILSKACTMGAS